MSEGAHPYTWLHAKEREDRELESTVGCSREESGGRASRGGDEHHEEQCVMKPTDRLRAHDADLDEQTKRKVQQEQRSGNVEERDHETYPFNAYPLHRRDYPFRMLHSHRRCIGLRSLRSLAEHLHAPWCRVTRRSNKVKHTGRGSVRAWSRW